MVMITRESSMVLRETFTLDQSHYNDGDHGDDHEGEQYGAQVNFHPV